MSHQVLAEAGFDEVGTDLEEALSCHLQLIDVDYKTAVPANLPELLDYEVEEFEEPEAA